MKRISILLLLLCTAAVIALSGCGGKSNAAQQKSALSKEDLLHHNFTLTHINGKAFTGTERTPSIEFNEGFRVSGATCNRFMGQAELKDGVLIVKEMASTMMLCADPDLNKLEQDFSVMLEAGADITFQENILTLSRNGYVLQYILSDQVQ